MEGAGQTNEGFWKLARHETRVKSPGREAPNTSRSILKGPPIPFNWDSDRPVSMCAEYLVNRMLEP